MRHTNHSSADEEIPASAPEILEEIQIPDQVNVTIESENSNDSDSEIEKDVMDMNKAFELSRTIYENFLAPQLVENEKLKREQKRNLIQSLFILLKVQFIFTYIFVTLLIVCVVFSGYLELSNEIISDLISFIRFYITSIVVELIAILFFIVKNVFDTSIVELIKGFDKRNNKEQDN